VRVCTVGSLWQAIVATHPNVQKGSYSPSHHQGFSSIQFTQWERHTWPERGGEGQGVTKRYRLYLGWPIASSYTRAHIYMSPWTKELKDTYPLMSSLLVICLGWCSNFVGSESGQKQSVKLLQNMVYSTIQHPPPPPQVTHTVLSVCTVCIHCTCSLGRGGEVIEKVQ
jgi:hypothetical protein